MAQWPMERSTTLLNRARWRSGQWKDQLHYQTELDGAVANGKINYIIKPSSMAQWPMERSTTLLNRARWRSGQWKDQLHY